MEICYLTVGHDCPKSRLTFVQTLVSGQWCMPPATSRKVQFGRRLTRSARCEAVSRPEAYRRRSEKSMVRAETIGSACRSSPVGESTILVEWRRSAEPRTGMRSSMFPRKRRGRGLRAGKRKFLSPPAARTPIAATSPRLVSLMPRGSARRQSSKVGTSFHLPGPMPSGSNAMFDDQRERLCDPAPRHARRSPMAAVTSNDARVRDWRNVDTWVTRPRLQRFDTAAHSMVLSAHAGVAISKWTSGTVRMVRWRQGDWQHFGKRGNLRS